MFTVINKHNIDEHQDKIDLLEAKFLEETGAEWTPSHLNDGGMYIVSCSKDQEIIGGAKIEPIEKTNHLNQYFCKNNYKVTDCWVITDIFFHISGQSPIQEDGDAFDHLAKQFYQNLYKEVLSLAKKEDQKVLMTFNPLEEQENIEYFGSWPFISKHLIAQEDERALGLLEVS